MRLLRVHALASLCLLAMLAWPGAGTASISGTLEITGAGFGHGIGMSQYGALGFALHGYDYQQILAHYYAGTTLGQVADPNVTVLLHDGGATVRGVTDANGRRLDSAKSYGVLARGSRLELISAGRTVGTFTAPLAVSGAQLAVVGMGRYAGHLDFRPDGSGGVLTINVVSLENYVRGVVPEEVSADWPVQALAAQAVAARSYVEADPPVNPLYQVYADTRSQVYGGLSAETAATNAVVAATAGQVVESGGVPAVTYFFSSSGGETEDVQNVFSGAAPEAWLVSVPDPYDDSGANPYYRWSEKLSLARAAKDLRGMYRGALEGIKVDRHGVSPRIVTATVLGSRGSSVVSGAALEDALGTWSTWMSFTTVTAKGALASGSGTASASAPATAAGAASTSTTSGVPPTGGAGVG